MCMYKGLAQFSEKIPTSTRALKTHCELICTLFSVKIAAGEADSVFWYFILLSLEDSSGW